MTISVLSQKGKVQPSVPERGLPNHLLVALVPCWVLFLGTVNIKHWIAFLVVTTERFPHTEIFISWTPWNFGTGKLLGHFPGQVKADRKDINLCCSRLQWSKYIPTGF